MKYKILAKDGRAKRADVETVHGTIHTPVFMNVGTVAAIKGAARRWREFETQCRGVFLVHLHQFQFFQHLHAALHLEGYTYFAIVG